MSAGMRAAAGARKGCRGCKAGRTPCTGGAAGRARGGRGHAVRHDPHLRAVGVVVAGGQRSKRQLSRHALRLFPVWALASAATSKNGAKAAARAVKNSRGSLVSYSKRMGMSALPSPIQARGGTACGAALCITRGAEPPAPPPAAADGGGESAGSSARRRACADVGGRTGSCVCGRCAVRATKRAQPLRALRRAPPSPPPQMRAQRRTVLHSARRWQRLSRRACACASSLATFGCSPRPPSAPPAARMRAAASASHRYVRREGVGVGLGVCRYESRRRRAVRPSHARLSLYRVCN